MVVPMATIAVFLKLDAKRVADCLQEVREKLESGSGETVLDFSSVRRIDPEGRQSHGTTGEPGGR